MAKKTAKKEISKIQPNIKWPVEIVDTPPDGIISDIPPDGIIPDTPPDGLEIQHIKASFSEMLVNRRKMMNEKALRIQKLTHGQDKN